MPSLSNIIIFDVAFLPQCVASSAASRSLSGYVPTIMTCSSVICKQLSRPHKLKQQQQWREALPRVTPSPSISFELVKAQRVRRWVSASTALLHPLVDGIPLGPVFDQLLLDGDSDACVDL